jgi:hypothetical protein
MKKIAFVAALIAVIVFGIVAYSFAAPSTDTKTVTVNAMANPKLTLAVSTSTVDFLGDPSVPTSTTPVVITVQSNKDYTLSKTVTDGTGALYVVNSSLPSPSAGAKGSADQHTDNVGVTISWNADPDVPLLGGSILYSATTNAP